MKEEISIGLVCLARKTFDFEAAFEIFKRIIEDLKELENVKWNVIPDLIIDITDAHKAAKKLRSTGIDALVCISGTFALGHLVLELNKFLREPILLWGLEELPYDGGKIRLNSVCGVNLNASNLYKAGVKNYHIVIGDKIDEDWLDAIRILKAFKSSHIGIIGSRAHGFFNLDVDELDLYKKLGVLIDYYQLNEILNLKIDYHKIPKKIENLKSTFNVSELTSKQIEKVAELIIRFDTFMKQTNLAAIAVRCWPEFANRYGISPCAAMSVLQSEGKILTCEGDILGSLSMLAHQAIGGKSPYLADFSQFNFKEDFALLWHCGVAPCNLWDGKCERSMDTYFAGGRGVTTGFVMKEGLISMLRLDYAPGEYRVFIQKAKAVPMKKLLKGTYAKVKFEKETRKVLDKVLNNGIAHHISVVYGDFMKPLEIFSKILGWNLIQ